MTMVVNKPKMHVIDEVKQKTPKTKEFSLKTDIADVNPGQFLMVWSPKVDEIPIAVAHYDPEN